jgi:membrane fusion protein, multidrug efflux system
VVKNDGLVATQPVRTGAVQGGLWLVSEGLKDGDRVIIDGFQKFVPGDKVKPKAWVDADASVGSISSVDSISSVGSISKAPATTQASD